MMSRRQGKKRGSGLVSVLSLALVFIVVTQVEAKVENKIYAFKANPGEFPFMVGIFEINRYGIAVKLCGGSIIDAHHILTAAHCVDPSTISNRKLVAKLGCHNLSECSNEYKISSSLIHPLYDRKLIDIINDIAILKTGERMNFTGSIGEGATGIIELPEADDFVDGESLTFTGWGLDLFDDSKILMKVNVSTMNWLECRKVFPDIIKSQICAGYMESECCGRHSGGPLFRTNGPNRHTLIGILSSGSVGSCGNKLADVYTRVASYIEWIEATVSPSDN